MNNPDNPAFSAKWAPPATDYAHQLARLRASEEGFRRLLDATSMPDERTKIKDTIRDIRAQIAEIERANTTKERT